MSRDDRRVLVWSLDANIHSCTVWTLEASFGYMKIIQITGRCSFDAMIAANYDEYSERFSRKTKSIIVPHAAIYQIAWQSKMGIFTLIAEKLFNSSRSSG